MSTSKQQTFIRLGIIAGIVLGAILLGKLTGEMDMVLDILKAISLVLIGITILVTIHELGHFLTAKAFGMRVEAFSIGFPPKLFSFTKGDTEYQLGATPLGGYVKISGMIDESMDTDHLQSEPKSYEYRSKPAWQRLVVMVGGVVMNVILGVFIFSMVKYGYGDERLPMSEVKYGVQVFENSLGELLGFKTGDKIVSYKGEQYEYFGDYANPNLLVQDEGYYEVERDGKIVRIDVPIGIQDKFSDDSIIVSLFVADMPAIVNIRDGGPAAKAGLQDGDQVIEIDSAEIKTFSALQSTVNSKDDFGTVQLAYLRDGKRFETTAKLDSGFLGVIKDQDFFQTQKETYSFFESFIPGTKQAFGFLFVNVQGLKQVAVGNASASKSVMGPIQIAKRYLDIFNQSGPEGFMVLTASLSMILAFVNMLPIPGLDGGHVMFLLIEMVMRRELPVKVRIGAQYVGMIFILLLMIFILGNDVRSLIF